MITNRLKPCLLFLLCSLFLSFPVQAEDNKFDVVSKKYGFSLEEEREIGFQSALSLLSKYGYYKNPLVNQYVTSRGESIVEKSTHRPLIKYRFFILDTPEINAFAAPGGFILITKGTLQILDNEAELAGILAHEISHVEDGHGLEAIASDPALQEKLKAVRINLDAGEGLSQKVLQMLDNELMKSLETSAIVNTNNAINAVNEKSTK